MTEAAMVEERRMLVRQAFFLAYIPHMLAISTGVAARSITLLAFGMDSLIELASAGVLISYQ